MKASRFKLILVLVPLLCIGAAGGVTVTKIRAAYGAVDPDDGAEVQVSLKEGLSGRQIAQRLQDAGVIRSALWFCFVARREGCDDRFQAGDYVLKRSMTAVELMEALTHGRSRSVAVTIPEGFTIRQIGRRLEDAGLVDAEAFVNAATNAGPGEIGGCTVDADSLEGYLFPDTYHVPAGATLEDIIGMMLDRFAEAIIQAHRPELEASDLGLSDIVTLASIVEREAQLSEERPIVAQVFLSRLEAGWKLESCATVQYLFDEPKPTLTYDDIAIESPYNTYIHPGLPPGPIGSPGESCVAAVLHPEDTEYMYFRTLGDGKHIFSKTLTEHETAGR